MNRRKFFNALWVLPFVAPAIVAASTKTEEESLLKVRKTDDGKVSLFLDDKHIFSVEKAADVSTLQVVDGALTNVKYKADKITIGTTNPLSITSIPDRIV